MRRYTIWDKKTDINGVNAEYFFTTNPYKNFVQNETIILTHDENDNVDEFLRKEVLAKHYDIDINLDIDTFMTQYFAILEKLEQQAEE